MLQKTKTIIPCILLSWIGFRCIETVDLNEIFFRKCISYATTIITTINNSDANCMASTGWPNPNHVLNMPVVKTLIPKKATVP